jgi:hypothetical protein
MNCLLVTLPAQNQDLNISQPLPDRAWMCSHQPMRRRLFDEVLIVVSWCAVAGQDAIRGIGGGW